MTGASRQNTGDKMKPSVMFNLNWNNGQFGNVYLLNGSSSHAKLQWFLYSICLLFVANPFFHGTMFKPLRPCCSSYTPSIPNQPGWVGVTIISTFACFYSTSTTICTDNIMHIDIIQWFWVYMYMVLAKKRWHIHICVVVWLIQTNAVKIITRTYISYSFNVYLHKAWVGA